MGEQFDADRFVETLKIGHVDTINLFAKCHHGYSFYPTQVGTMHPNLKFDLLGRQVEALHKADIRCPIYVSVKSDYPAGTQHPEWVCTARMASSSCALRQRAVGLDHFNVSTSYGDLFMSQAEELCRRFGDELDGFWFDITFAVPNYSPWSQERMRQTGVDIADETAVYRYARLQDLGVFSKSSAN